jgi:hypothetical protein
VEAASGDLGECYQPLNVIRLGRSNKMICVNISNQLLLSIGDYYRLGIKKSNCFYSSLVEGRLEYSKTYKLF